MEPSVACTAPALPREPATARERSVLSSLVRGADIATWPGTEAQRRDMRVADWSSARPPATPPRRASRWGLLLFCDDRFHRRRVDHRSRHHARSGVPLYQQGRPGLGRRHVAEGAVGRRARRRRSGRHRQAGTPRPQTHVCPSSAISPVANWTRFSSCSGTSRFRRQSATSDASRSSGLP